MTWNARRNEQRNRRRREHGRGDRSAEYAKRKTAPHRSAASIERRRAAFRDWYHRTHPPKPPKVKRAPEPKLEPLFPDLVKGTRLSFWEEELSYDLRQEAALAELEGRDPVQAVAEFRTREMLWRLWARPLLIEP